MAQLVQKSRMHFVLEHVLIALGKVPRFSRNRMICGGSTPGPAPIRKFHAREQSQGVRVEGFPSGPGPTSS